MFGTLVRKDWFVVVDLGVDETLRYLFPETDHGTAKREGERRARAEAVERHLPTTRVEVFVCLNGTQGPLDPNRCTSDACDGEMHYDMHQQDAETGEYPEVGPCPFWDA